MLTIKIDTAYPAFSETPATELARLLRYMADLIECDGPPDYMPFITLDGVTVGQCEYIPPAT